LEGAVDGVELSGKSPVLTAVLGASDVVCAPVDVEDPDGELVEVPEDESDDESDGSARASPCPESTAAPTPSAIIRPANRPIPRTTSLTRMSSTITTSPGKKKAFDNTPEAHRILAARENVGKVVLVP
jgi:hypothetical protein